ncbi:hypothetical protein C8F04DRAFT_1299190 [Mycena alexandri]|uniref:Uncharacterized protein n=1 Tax=Mycena alexandri TaxID=1745969 RepID=A0AAD6T8C6_9AGAR|nr:hypothetical protein C8F04DRAFT_1299190 [Mycena alexandri]
MHWASLNWTELNYLLSTGKIECEAPDTKDSWDWVVLTGDVWKKHGQAVADATPYLPGSFERPPRNAAEKILSGYKAWEWLMYFIGLGPALLLDILPDKYCRHCCKGISVIRCFHQRKLPATQMRQAHLHALEYVSEFEALYYQQKEERLHFVRQSVHVMVHLAPEAIRVGPQPYVAQWTMERTIGNLGEEIKQHSDPYANLSQRGLRRCQFNMLKALIPGLTGDDTRNPLLPRGCEDLGDGYVLLRARDEWPTLVVDDAASAIRKLLNAKSADGDIKLKRWARLRLPNGQIARSAWKERNKPLKAVRMARNVKVTIDGPSEIAEVEFYCRSPQGRALALGSLYPRPDADLLHKSYNTVWSCTAPRGYVAIWAKNIQSVVAMEPHIYRAENS